MKFLTNALEIALPYCRKNGRYQKVRGSEIGVGNTDPSRPFARKTRQHIKTRSGHQYVAHAGALCPGTDPMYTRQV